MTTTTKTIREIQYLGPDGQPIDFVPGVGGDGVGGNGAPPGVNGPPPVHPRLSTSSVPGVTNPAAASYDPSSGFNGAGGAPNGYSEQNSPNSSQLSSEGQDATLISRTQKQHTTQQVKRHNTFPCSWI